MSYDGCHTTNSFGYYRVSDLANRTAVILAESLLSAGLVYTPLK